MAAAQALIFGFIAVAAPFRRTLVSIDQTDALSVTQNPGRVQHCVLLL
jgi:hypothetical protein